VAVLVYREDLVREYGYAGPPATWDELERMAARIQAGERAKGQAGFWGYAWQGASYEGLTCNALEWQAAEGGGSIVEADGTVSVNNPRARHALERATSWVGTISPPGVIAYKEDDGFNLWSAGQVAFVRGWLTDGGTPDTARMHGAIAPMPGGSAGRAGTLGGWSLAVSRYSFHQAEALKYVRYMTSPAVQAQRFLAIGYPPTTRHVPLPDDVSRVNPYYVLRPQLVATMVARPSRTVGRQYPMVSRAYFEAVHSVLTRQERAADALAALEVRLRRLLAGEGAGRP
jgi:trehalose/maltose transport system substrate-binding protein